MTNLYVALTHYPVTNKNGETIASAVTNLDLHDISRSARTYGVRTFYVITPLTDQKTLVQRIVGHWVNGAGARYNPKRREALKLIEVRDTFAEVLEHIENACGCQPKIVATCARDYRRSIGCETLGTMLENGDPYLLVFGTAWGLATSFIEGADYILEPIRGVTDYNHLSVRSAASIILDRLLGRATAPI